MPKPCDGFSVRPPPRPAHKFTRANDFNGLTALSRKFLAFRAFLTLADVSPVSHSEGCDPFGWAMTILASNPRGHDQTFRYAALSTGLDIVRKALGGHESASHMAWPYLYNRLPRAP
jgi:hypothetical protein